MSYLNGGELTIVEKEYFSEFKTMIKKGEWYVNIYGEKCSESFEISIIKYGYENVPGSWGWFDENKLLVSHNGGPCHWPLTETVWDSVVDVAVKYVKELNERDEIKNNCRVFISHKENN